MGRLVDMLEEFGVYLVLAAPGRDLDLSRAGDRIALQIIGMMDEWYAADIAIRVKDSVAYRRLQGLRLACHPLVQYEMKMAISFQVFRARG